MPKVWTWDKLISKYVQHTALSLLKLKNELHDSKLESIERDPDECISNLGGLQIHTDEFIQKDNISNEYFMTLVLNNFPSEYDVILDALENLLTLCSDIALMIEIIREKLNHREEKIKNENEAKSKKEKALRAFSK